MMKLSALLLAGTLALIPAASLASPPMQRSFEHDGDRFTYTVTKKGEARILEGIKEGSGERFKLLVKGRHVSGVVAGNAVAFRHKSLKSLERQALVVESR